MTDVPKVAPRPHVWTVIPNWLAIVISVVSAAFAYLGWHETDENTKINEKTSVASLNVSSFMLDPRKLYVHPDARLRYALAYVTVTNTGKVAAKRVRLEQAIRPPGSYKPKDARTDGFIANIGALTETASGSLGDVSC